ncbi:alpha-(1,3)-fucosyltransferase C-like isoform X2 [Danaus plexippus]|uniref:alpha-(1,3)-fucosyltransferase C-like isoform X2 n=1 Tax=Danaus plexippus TaxID=13037 RepID=UPI002AB2CA56|nr:alpha-(1,3)-fucosyltransferase C-like isoform X2 [Danaus plexippus]
MFKTKNILNITNLTRFIVLGALFCVSTLFYTYNHKLREIKMTTDFNPYTMKTNVKNILQWTSGDLAPFNFMGPAMDMKWPEHLDPVSDELKEKLAKKKRTGAWFVSNCSSKSKREIFMNYLQNELKQYNLSVDVYGSCGRFSCPRKMYKACAKLLQEDYYFYFSMENSFSEDYVTEKLLTALNNYAIPVVFGAADYTRFLPPGSYLNGKQLGVTALAQKMYEIITNKTLFYDYFRWRNHFVYKETSSKEDICKLCEMLNNEEKVSEISEWPDFRRWWNGERYRDNCP